MKHSFKRCGISNALDGSENDVFNRKLQEAVDEHRRESECKYTFTSTTQIPISTHKVFTSYMSLCFVLHR